MGRLTSLKPRVQAVSTARVGPAHSSGVLGFSDSRRGSRHERGYGWAWDQAVKRIRARDFDLCQACARRGEVGFYAAVDHRIPKAEGGTEDDANLEVICRPCHADKTAAEARRGKGY